jgi:ABC-type Zn uptake system ZnuABC Zn-binding protein ZnuA
MKSFLRRLSTWFEKKVPFFQKVELIEELFNDVLNLKPYLVSVSILALVVLSLVATACQSAGESAPVDGGDLSTLTLPALSVVSLNGQPLKVVATTSIVGDVVRQVGREAIVLTVLIAPGQDPHSYEPSSGDLTAAADADVIFVNGWNLEEGLVRNLENASNDGLIVPVSAGIQVLAFGGHEHDEEVEHDPETADPHVWLDPHNVVQWVDNISVVLGTLDPDNAEVFRQNAAEYQAELEQLIQYYDEQVARIPADNRVLITNHDSFGYFAAAYDFEIIGTVLPGASTLAEPSANALAELVDIMDEAGVCTIFAETTANIKMAQTAAAELANCDNVAVQSLYTGALGPPGSGADTYITMMEANMETLIEGLYVVD